MSQNTSIQSQRTYWKPLLALALVLTMVFSLCSVVALAEEKYPQYTEYTFFGDSVTAAYGIPDYFKVKEANGTAEGYRVKDSYADVIATAVGIEGEEKYHNEAHSGWRTSEVREILDETYDNSDGGAARGIASVFGASGGIGTLEENRARIIPELQNSDLITLDIGSNDLQLPLLFSLMTVMNPTASEDYKAWKLEELLQQYSGDSNQVLSTLTQAVVLAHGVTFAVQTISNAALTGYKKFVENYPVIMREIHELNPDATIVSIGFYNPFSQTRITPNIPISIGKVIDPVIQSMNVYMSSLCPARNLYTYADAFNVTTIGTINLSDFLSGSDGNLFASEAANNFMLYIHPSVEGHAYIASQVLKVLPEKKTSTSTTDDSQNSASSGNSSSSNSGSNSTAPADSDDISTWTGRWVRKNPVDGKWYLFEDENIDYSYTGIAKNEYGWWRIEEGEVNFNATGVYKNEYGWWRVEKGKVNFKANGIYKNQYGWWKTTNGKVTFQETGVFQNEYGTWYVVKSKVDFSKTGTVKDGNRTYKIQNGKVVG